MYMGVQGHVPKLRQQFQKSSVLRRINTCQSAINNACAINPSFWHTDLRKSDPLAEGSIRVKVFVFYLLESPIEGSPGCSDLFSDVFGRHTHKAHMVNSGQGDVVLRNAFRTAFLLYDIIFRLCNTIAIDDV